ncbi:putative quinol monooxygenase [Scatolibacter rhodanostii]|uniref:putative quinol monooxygenase n=1 Tax=Scatolibacter rhodanostii TaxID=2014781 RepID=UPI000C086D0C|nr:putative quinol monooxygenase [Scatolibacter rhodanostii]
MITIVAKNIVKPECKADFLAAVQPLIEASRAEEGNISYDLFEDLSNANILTFIERWKDQEAINTHNTSSHFTSILPTLGAYTTGGIDVSLYKPCEE